VDASALPEEDARRLGELVDAAVAEPPPGGDGGSARDGMSYTITVDRDRGSGQVLRRSDTTMSEAFADLLGFVRERGTPPSL
jgi:hypothetical protein